MTGVGALVGVGVGPGDPEHVTLKAVRELREADRVFVPATSASAGGAGRAETVAAAHVAPERLIRLGFAMADEDGRDAQWDAAGQAIARVVDAGGTAAFATLGDPSVYSTFAYVVQTVRALAPGVTVRTVPGITAMQDLAARTGAMLAEGTDGVALIPWTAGEARVRAALDAFETVVIYKGGRHLPRLLEVVREAGREDEATVGTHLGLGGEVVTAAGAADGPVPYFSTVLVTPARDAAARGGRL
ncbi:MAG TPA: precorrin-2 C(20)-methyltransferase [Baekduia sp.]|uniref:precorrin-2 C(20)-methyltransferase n=1 Tax=Baekduia sp. TaxID=2600305 RepID=UPI002BBCCDDC|nr:precorrin-2 C(20)-methyltransferase [Baekduia sp.]HMJ33432.1 precorrin-2 C(20)-methyltransferase [Baekduia sp.]